MATVDIGYRAYIIGFSPQNNHLLANIGFGQAIVWDLAIEMGSFWHIFHFKYQNSCITFRVTLVLKNANLHLRVTFVLKYAKSHLI